MPGITTLASRIGDTSCFPGFSNEVLKQLERRISAMQEKGKHCTIIFDKIKIKKCLEYSKKFDKIEGFEDHREGKRSGKFGTQIMLFMARGIYTNWKLPLGYFVSADSMKGVELASLIKRAIIYAKSAGLQPVAMVCDQGSNNRAALKHLGSLNDRNYFEIHNIENTSIKIWVIYDALHLFKNFRNNWITHWYLFKNKVVNFKDVKDTYEIDTKSSTGRSLMKITEAHINPDSFQKMSCKLATQIFSHSVSTAIKTAKDTGELKSDMAYDTANFVEFMNNLFDTLNSKELYSKNPYSSAISAERPLVKETLEEALNTVTSLKKITKNGLKTHNTVYFRHL